jgi:hypothetical protein
LNQTPKKYHPHSSLPLQHIKSRETILFSDIFPIHHMPSQNHIVLIPATQLQTILVQLTILLQQILENLVKENADDDEEQPSST